MKHAVTIFRAGSKRPLPIRTVLNPINEDKLLKSAPSTLEQDSESTSPEPQSPETGKSLRYNHSKPRHLNGFLTPTAKLDASPLSYLREDSELEVSTSSTTSLKEVIEQSFEIQKKKSELIKNPKMFTEMKVGLKGTVSFLATGNIKYLHNPYMHTFKHPLRQVLHNSMMQLELETPAAESMRSLIVQNNSIQDLHGCDLAEKTIDAFIKHVFELEHADPAKIYDVSIKCHKFLAEAFREGGQYSGYLLHHLGMFKDYTSKLAAEAQKPESSCLIC